MQTKIRVLHIDDNLHDRQLVKDALLSEHNTFEVVEADDREKFLQHLGSKDFDIILSDFNILGFDGLQVLELVKEKYPDMPVIIVTGTGTEEVAAQAIKMGASDYVIKSVKHIRGLAHTINLILENKKMLEERKVASKALLKSEEKYRKIFENVQDVFFQIDGQDIITDISPSIYRVSGHQRDELIGNALVNLYFDPLEHDILTNLIEQKGEVWDHEIRIKTKSAQLKFASLNVHILLNEENKPEGLEGSMRDITDRKQMEEELSQSRNELQEYFENDISADYISAVEGNILSCNRTFLNMFGFEEKVQTENFDITQLFKNSEDRKVLLQRVRQSKKLENYEVDFVSKNGHTIHSLLNAIGIFEDNKLLKIRGYIVDISRQKNAEKQLEKLSIAVEQSPVSIIITDLNGKIEYINPKTNELTGYSREELIGQNPRIFGTHEKPSEEYQILWETLLSGKIWQGEFHNRKKNGEYYWELVTISPIFNEKNEPVNYIAVKEDITRQKSLTQELILAKEKAEESDQLKTAFLHNISHEIRTPMNSIVGFSEFINEPNLRSQKRKEFTKIIVKSSNQLLSIISDIVNIATIEAGQAKVSEKEVDLNTTLRLLQAQFIPQANEKNIDIKLTHLLPDNEVRILSDETKLIQILTNLIGNALKFTRKGVVNFGYKKCGNELEFFVQDSGIGIPPEMHEEIFKRFRQVETNSTRQFGGSGLGLSISKAYAELLGGRMWMSSEVGKGSTFYFAIQYKPFPENESSTEQNTNGIQATKTTTKTLLIAEDEDSNFMLLEAFLSGVNIKIIRAIDGLEAVEICKTHSIDLVLMDIKMPNLDGYQATLLIKEFLPDLPIIAQTAYSTDIDRNKALESGCSDYISKPIRKELLIQKINNQLNQK